MTYQEWVATQRHIDASNGLRLGQSFVIRMLPIDTDSFELFNTTDEDSAWEIINQYVKDYQWQVGGICCAQ